MSKVSDIDYLVSLWVERGRCDRRNEGRLPQHRDRCSMDGGFCTFNHFCRHRDQIQKDIQRRTENEIQTCVP